jgi:uncharacterized protein
MKNRRFSGSFFTAGLQCILVVMVLTLASTPCAKGSDKDTEIAKRKAWAEQGDLRAQLNLGDMYFFGKGVPKNLAEAAKWYRKAAEQGNPDAQYDLYLTYITDQGISKKDLPEALKWLRKAADQGHPVAQYSLGFKYYLESIGIGALKNGTEAAEWLRKAAEQGHPGAQNYLGELYAMGKGVLKDWVEAVKWYRKAAEQDYNVAQNNLGDMYAKGEGVSKDLAEAVKWYRKAAEHGNPDAQLSLARAYADGAGVPKNYVQAYKWVNLASTKGKPSILGTAAKMRDGLETKMTREEMTEAQRLSAQFVPRKTGGGTSP